jgi:hypothetical protein
MVPHDNSKKIIFTLAFFIKFTYAINTSATVEVLDSTVRASGFGERDMCERQMLP